MDPLLVRVWVAYQVLRFLAPPQPAKWVLLQLPFVILAAWTGRIRPAALVNIVTFAAHAPFLVDMDWWAMLTDLTLVLIDDPLTAQQCIRGQLGIFYAACAFWKMTWDFLDPTVSCGTLMLVQLCVGWFGQAHRLIAVMAPILTILLEAGCSLVATGSKFGILLAVLLHTGIVMAPLPLSISDFSALAASRLFWAHGNSSIDSSTFRRCLAFAGIFVAVVSKVHASIERLPANCVFAVFAALHVALLLRPPPPRKKTKTPPIVLGLWTVTFLYAFLAPILGLLDVGAAHMFANLRLHSGPSNHVLAPTSLLQSWLRDADPHGFFFGDFAGGDIRVDFTDSDYVSAYPGEISKLDPFPQAQDTLRELGHVARVFKMTRLPATGSQCCRGTRPREGHAHQGWQHKVNIQNFTRYTLPALELRVLLLHARQLTSNFSFVYTRLQQPPTTTLHGSSAWRRACGHQVFLQYSNASFQCRYHYSCTSSEEEDEALSSSDVVDHIFQRHTPCAETELAMLPPPHWAHRLLLSNAYPILDDRDFDPRYCGTSG